MSCAGTPAISATRLISQARSSAASVGWGHEVIPVRFLSANGLIRAGQNLRASEPVKISGLVTGPALRPLDLAAARERKRPQPQQYDVRHGDSVLCRDRAPDGGGHLGP